MNLTEIPNGARVLVDTNILLYAIRGESPQCARLLERCRELAIDGFITTVTIAECCHRLMMAEARQKGYFAAANPAKALSARPAVICSLTDYAERIRGLLGSALQARPIEPADFSVALTLQQRWGMLTNDSLQLAVAERLGIPSIASADAGFDSVQGLLVYKPNDLMVRPEMQDATRCLGLEGHL